MIQIQVTENEYNLLCLALDEAYEKLSSMMPEERKEWYENSLFSVPINFQRVIDGTIYSVNTHFNSNSNECINEKIVRLLELRMNKFSNHALKC
ncbi:hypothetical protein [Eubacterium sp.]|uniref:hypothetical protein n=1 Tax=Eubacterium sp. TaxID=142586 RepID=UPI0025B83C69|nr:hypothetical protein [Eubacterium sp.]MCI7800230.1 hypothetical protein [Eubacterium sp.]